MIKKKEEKNNVQWGRFYLDIFYKKRRLSSALSSYFFPPLTININCAMVATMNNPKKTFNPGSLKLMFNAISPPVPIANVRIIIALQMSYMLSFSSLYYSEVYPPRFYLPVGFYNSFQCLNYSILLTKNQFYVTLLS